MALHPGFPTSPYAPLIPAQRWFSNDVPDFIARDTEGTVWIIDTIFIEYKA